MTLEDKEKIALLAINSIEHLESLLNLVDELKKKILQREIELISKIDSINKKNDHGWDFYLECKHEGIYNELYSAFGGKPDRWEFFPELIKRLDYMNHVSDHYISKYREY